jgi:P27 family predicted phage terminase small subunit
MPRSKNSKRVKPRRTLGVSPGVRKRKAPAKRKPPAKRKRTPDTGGLTPPRSPDTGGLTPPRSPDTPAWLGDVAAAKWAQIHALLAELRLIDDRDRDAVALYCDAWQQLADANATIKKKGEYFETDKGYVGLHPAVLKRRKAVDVIRKLGEQLGLTPRARTNLASANRPAKSDPLQQFLTKRPG